MAVDDLELNPATNKLDLINSKSSIIAACTTSFLKLDQTVPQSVVDGAPSFEAIQINTTPIPLTNAEGLMQWNSTDGTLDIGMSAGQITMQVGQEMFAKVRNDTLLTISNGEAVYISGRTGVFPDVKLARGDAESTSRVLGIATQDIPIHPGYGFITTVGYVRGIKTDYAGLGIWGDTWVTGDLLYLSKTVAGQLTNLAPSSPNHSDTVASVGIVGGVGTGSIFVNIERHKTLEELSDVDGTALNTDGQIPLWDDTNSYFDFSDAFPQTGHYTGFPSKTSSLVPSALSWVDGALGATRTLTLAPSGLTHNIYINGVQHTIGTLTKQVPDVTGLYWFWIELVLGVPTLQAQIGAPGFDKCLVATVYWNTAIDSGLLSDERHWMGRDQWMHEYLHETVGARYYLGLTGTFANTTFSITAGEFYDEDIEHQLSADTPMAYPGTAITTCKVLYRNGSADWEWDSGSTTPYKITTGNLRFNTGNILSTAAANRFVNYWIFASAGVAEPIWVVVGTAEYTTIAAARAATVPSLGTLPSAETKLIYKVTYKNDGVPTYQEAIDYRASQVLGSTFTPTDHSTLSNLSYATSGHTGALDLGAFALTAARVNLDTAASYIDTDISGNLTLTDAISGTKTLKQLGCPTMVKLIATGLSAGNNNLTYASWAVSKAQIMRITVTSASTDFNIEIFEKDTFLAANSIFTSNNNSLSLDSLIGSLIYEDQDATSEIHIKLTDNAGASTFNVEIRGIELI